MRVSGLGSPAASSARISTVRLYLGSYERLCIDGAGDELQGVKSGLR
jgi:hypothetical protein